MQAQPKAKTGYKLTPRKIAITGVLGALSIFLGMTPIGFIPIPFTPAGSATIMHIPVILGAILEGPVVGAMVGLIFGLSSFIRGGAFFVDPLVAIPPRILIGVIAGYIFYVLPKNNWGLAITGAVGTLTNTIGVLGIALLRGYLPNIGVAGSIALIHGVPEIIVAILIVVAVYRVLNALNWD